jgi:integrase
MGKIKWERAGKGLQSYSHETRKHGVNYDRCFRGRYKVDKKETAIVFGWESEWVAGEKARRKATGEKGPRISFVDHCKGELLRLKDNARKGSGPGTIKEERALAEIQRNEEDQARVAEEKESITFGAYFKKVYLPIATTHKKPDTIKEEKSVFKVWLKPYLGNRKLRDLRPLHLERLKRDMLEKKKAPRRVQYVLAISRQVWNTARNEGVVSGDWPGRGVKIPKIDNRRMRFLSLQESEDLLSELKSRSQQAHDITLISLDCGLRFGEIVKLQWGHVNIGDGIIMVVDPKGTKNRAAFMTARVKEMFQAMPMGNKTDLVFKDTNGQPIKKISKTFSRAVDHLGLNDGVTDRRDRVVYHSARHTFASNLISNGADLYVVSQLLGHADVTMAARYSHLGAGSLRAAVQRMEKATAEKSQNKVIPLVVNGGK